MNRQKSQQDRENDTFSSHEIVQTVQKQYGSVALSGLTNETAAVRTVAQAFGYSDEELNSLPAEANMGLSCGNPVAMASLHPGEVVVDLGCGGGLDVLLAAQKVGPKGKAIGIDMTEEMLTRARAGAAKVGADNVEFLRAEIDQLPLPDQSVDCIISNCVINLVPDKDRVFREMLRVLRPGGRLAISDIALKQPLPPDVRASMEAYVGCISGAIPIDEYRERLLQAGFAEVAVTDTGSDLNAYATSGLSSVGCCADIPQPAQVGELPIAGCCGGSAAPADQGEGLIHDHLIRLFATFDANAYAASVRVLATRK